MTYSAPRSDHSIASLTLPPGRDARHALKSDKKYLVLPGGGSGGAWVAGAMWVLLQEGFLDDIDAIVGTSAGAINGAAFAKDPTREGLLALMEMWSSPQVAALNNKPLAVSIAGREHGRRRRGRYLAKVLRGGGLDKQTFDDLQIKLLIGATMCGPDQPATLPASGTESALRMLGMMQDHTRNVAFPRTDSSKEMVLPAVMASAAQMIVFPRVTIDGEVFVDGGFTDNFGVSLALEDGATSILLVDGSLAPPSLGLPDHKIGNTLDLLHAGQADTLLQRDLMLAQAANVPVALFKLASPKEGFNTAYCNLMVLGGIRDLTIHMETGGREVPGVPHHSSKEAGLLIAEAIVGEGWARNVPESLRVMLLERIEPNHEKWPDIREASKEALAEWADSRNQLALRVRSRLPTVGRFNTDKGPRLPHPAITGVDPITSPAEALAAKIRRWIPNATGLGGGASGRPPRGHGNPEVA